MTFDEESVWVLHSPPESARVNKSQPESARVSQSQQEPAKVSHSHQMSSRRGQNHPESTSVCQSKSLIYIFESFGLLGAPEGPLNNFFVVAETGLKLLLWPQNQLNETHACFRVLIQKRSQKLLKLELIMTSFWHNMQPKNVTHIRLRRSQELFSSKKW